jgi:hypothetical protein
VTDMAGHNALVLNDSPVPANPADARSAEDFNRECARRAAICRARAAYHEWMLQKWLRAAKYPWASLPSDPDPSLPFPVKAGDVGGALF